MRDSNPRMAESKSAAFPTWRIPSCLVDRRGVEPRTPPCKGGVFPIIPTAQLFYVLFVYTSLASEYIDITVYS